MAIEETINDIHALTADAIKLGAKQEREYIFAYLHRHLGPDLAVNTSLSQKVAYTFAKQYLAQVEADLYKISNSR